MVLAVQCLRRVEPRRTTAAATTAATRTTATATTAASATTADFGGLVHDYSYKPRPVFHGTGPLFLGPEIEIETPYCAEEECAQIAYSLLGSLGYLKNDARSDNGFEIVTHPMSYQWAMDNFPWQMLTELRDAGCCSHGRARASTSTCPAPGSARPATPTGG